MPQGTPLTPQPPSPAVSADAEPPTDMLHAPFNIDAERAVLGACMHSADVIDTVRSVLGDAAFYRPAHETIWRALLSQHREDKPTDPIALTELLERQGDLHRVGGNAYVFQLADVHYGTGGAEHHAEIIREKANLRRLLASAIRTVQRAQEPGADPEAIRSEVEAEMRAERERALASGHLKGYTVALPGDRNRDKEPIYYAGSTLAPDLSLPRIQERFTTDSTPPGTADSERQQRSTASSAPATARRTTAHAAWAAVLVLDYSSDDGAAAAQIAAAGEVLDALAKTSALHTRDELRQAAWEFERASRSHTRAEFRHAQDLRRAARDLVYSGPAFGRGEDGASTAMVLDTLVFLAIATAHWHAQRQHAQQAEAARRAATHLRAAYQQAAAEPLVVLRERGRRIVPSLRRHHATTVRAALPGLAETILAEPGWDALATTLADATQAGHNPQALLVKAAARRELGTADSISDVLVWRLRRMADLPAYAPAPEPTRASRLTDRQAMAPHLAMPTASRAPRR
ncbi:DnaB-like helicase N-terminal domain-containing protein [Streptomyces sp. NPDC088801]|uniref:DnaB-like helicase N-terminal domain-containing protein n=1 Tax=Streptomyces sp. NPDC088801 TaxID=3365903 RepID=UPI003830166B